LSSTGKGDILVVTNLGYVGADAEGSLMPAAQPYFKAGKVRQV
jgi:hypothetical protein